MLLFKMDRAGPNCLFCLEPIRSDSLRVPLLPCMCRLDHHDQCRDEWNRINPYKCPLCREKFETFTIPVLDSVDATDVYIPIVNTPSITPTAPPSEPANSFQQNLTVQERRRMRSNTFVCGSFLIVIIMILLCLYGYYRS